MYDVYSALRRTRNAKQAITTVNIHRSGWKIKLDGSADLSDNGIETLAKQQQTQDGLLANHVKGKAETESHTVNAQFPVLQTELLSMLQGKEIATEAPAQATLRDVNAMTIIDEALQGTTKNGKKTAKV